MRKQFAVLVPAAAAVAALVMAIPAHGTGARMMLSDFMQQCLVYPGYCEGINGSYITNAENAKSICVPKSMSHEQAVKDMMSWMKKQADKGKSISLDNAQWDAVNALFPCGGEENNKV